MNEQEYIDQLIDAGASDEEIAEALVLFRQRQIGSLPSTPPSTPTTQLRSGTPPTPSFMGLQFASEEDANKPWYLRKIVPTKEASRLFERAAAIGAFPQAVGKGLVSDPLKAIAIGGQFVERELLGIDKPIEEYPTYQAGQAAEEFIEEAAPLTEEQRQSFLGKLSGGLGTAAAIAVTAPSGFTRAGGTLLGRGINYTGQFLKRALGPTGVVAGAMMGVPEYEEALKSGLSAEESFRVFLLNYGLAQTDIFPLERAFRMIDNIPAKNIATHVMKAMLSGAGTEAVQEGIQTYLSNRVAEGSYDPKRDPMLGVWESIGYGALIGALIPGGLGTIKGLSQVRNEADKSIEFDADTGNREINTQVDKQTEEIINTIQNAKEVRSDEGQIQEAGDVQQTSEGQGGQDLQQPEKVQPETGEQVQIGLTITPRKPELSPEINDILDKVNRGEPITQSESDALEAQEPTTFDWSYIDERGGTAKGAISGNVASIGEAYAAPITSENKEDFERKGFLTNVIRSLSRRGVKRITIPAQSHSMTAALARLTEKGILSNPRAEAIKGVPTLFDITEETITLPILKALKEQIKTFYRGMEKGVRKGQKNINEQLIPKAQQALKKAKLTPRQTSSILRKIKTTNLFTPGSFSRLNDFIDKVVADAQYAEKLGEARTLRKRIKGFAKRKAEGGQSEYKILARDFARINPTSVDVDEYIENAQKIAGRFRPVTDPKYLTPSIDEIEDYIDKSLESQKKKQDEEIDSIDSEKSEEEKTETLRSIAQSSLDNLSEKDLSDFSETEKRSINKIKEIDLNQLTDHNQLKRLIKIIDNIVVNDDLSDEAFVEVIVDNQIFLDKLDNLLKKKKGQKFSVVKLVGKIGFNPSNIFKRIYQDKDIETIWREHFNDLTVKGSQREANFVKMGIELDDKIKSVNKKYKTEVRDITNQVRLKLFSLIVQLRTPSEIKKLKRNIIGTIKRHGNAGNTEEENAWAKAFELFGGDANFMSSDQAIDLVKKKYPHIYEMWSFFRNHVFTKELAEMQAKVAKEVFDREYIPVENYLPIVQHPVNHLYGKINRAEEEASVSIRERSLEAKQADTAKKRTLNLRKNHVYSSTPLNDWLFSYSQTWYERAKKDEMKLVELLKNPRLKELVGGKENEEAVVGSLLRFLATQRGIHDRLSDKKWVENFVTLANTFRHIGTIRALASVFQVAKQSTVSVKTYINLLSTGDADLMVPAIHAVGIFKKSENHPVMKLLEQSTLVARSLRLGGTDRGTSELYKIQRGATKTFNKFITDLGVKVDKRVRRTMSLLTKPDVFNARIAYLSYYLKSLRDQGVKDVDLNTEYQKADQEERRKAKAYAETMVEKTQTASNPALLSEFQSKAGGAAEEFFKTVLFPFSTFDADFKARLINEVSAVRRSPTSENLIQLSGTVGEALTFAFISGGLGYFLQDFLRDLISKLAGVDRPEKTEEQKKKELKQRIASNLFQGLNPLAIGTIPTDIQSMAVNTAAYELAKLEDPSLTRKDWNREQALLYTPKEGTLLENLGVLSTGMKPIVEIVRESPKLLSILGQPVTVIDGYGNEKEIYLTEEQQIVLIAKLLTETLTLSGRTEVEIANAIRAVYSEQLKVARSDTKPELSATPSTNYFRRPQPQPFRRPPQ